MTQQFKSTGVPLFKSTGVPAMDPDCCCDLCAVVIFFEDCDIFWYVDPIPGVTYSVRIQGPGGFDETYIDIPGGVIPGAATGTWTATLTFGSSSCEHVITIEECTPPYLCCRNTTGLYGVFSNIPSGEKRANPNTGTGKWTELWLGDHTDANVAWYRDLTTAGTKTDFNCYDLVTPSADVLIGTGWERRYSGMVIPGPITTCPSEADALAQTDYHVVDVAFDIYLRFTGANTVRVVGISTSSSSSTIGLPPGSTPPTIANGTVAELISFQVASSTYEFQGKCGYATVQRFRGSFLGGLINSCPPTTPFPTTIFYAKYEGWPVITP